MSQEYYNLERTAEILKLTPGDVNRMREQNLIRAFRDGANWKFRKEDVEATLADMVKKRSQKPADEPLEEPEEDFLSFGPEGDEELSTQMVDLDTDELLLVEDDDSDAESDLYSLTDDGLELVEEGSTDSSVVYSEATITFGKDSQEERKPKEIPISQKPLNLEKSSSEAKPGSGINLAGDSGIELAGGSGSGINLSGDSGIELGGGSGIDLSAGGSGSGINLAGDSGLIFGEDDNIVLGASSGLSLGNDSGLSLIDEEGRDFTVESDDGILELEEDSDILALVGSDDSESPTLLSEGNDFELVADTVGSDDSESSSQIISIDGDDPFAMGSEIDAGEGFGETDMFADMPASGGFPAPMPAPAATVPAPGAGAGPVPAFGADEQGFGSEYTPTQAARSAVPTEANYGGLVIGLGLAPCIVLLGVGGMMMFELIRNMWSWNQTTMLSSWIMEPIAGMLGLR